MVRKIVVGMTGTLLVALVANCGGGDDDTAGPGPRAGAGNEASGGSGLSNAGGGAARAGAGQGGLGQAGAGGSGRTWVGECETIDGLDVTSECAASAVEGQLKRVNVLLVMDKSTSMNLSFGGEEAGAGGASAQGGAGVATAGAGTQAGAGGAGAQGATAGAAAQAGAGGAVAGGASRWDVLKQALGDSMTVTQATVDYGLLLYPSGEGCGVTEGVQVPVGAGSSTVPEIVSALDDNPPDVSGTPMAAALDAALEYYTNGAGADRAGDKYVLLATDGGPNCNESLTCTADDCTLNLEKNCPIHPDSCCDFGAESCVDHADVTAKITELRDAGVDTFVVGIPGSEAYATWLGEFADAGGQNPDGAGSYYQVSAGDGAAGLTETFSEIAKGLVTDCEIPIDVEVPDVAETNVAVDCEVVTKSEVDGSGWAFNDNLTQITITGEKCEEIRTSGVERIDVIFGCPVVR